jgi:hypothetical protein
MPITFRIVGEACRGSGVVRCKSDSFDHLYCRITAKNTYCEAAMKADWLFHLEAGGRNG